MRVRARESEREQEREWEKEIVRERGERRKRDWGKWWGWETMGECLCLRMCLCWSFGLLIWMCVFMLDLWVYVRACVSSRVRESGPEWIFSSLSNLDGSIESWNFSQEKFSSSALLKMLRKKFALSWKKIQMTLWTLRPSQTLRVRNDLI